MSLRFSFLSRLIPPNTIVSSKRFPLAVLFCVVFTLYSFALIAKLIPFDDKILKLIFTVLLLACFAYMPAYLYKEEYSLSSKKEWLPFAVSTAYVGITAVILWYCHESRFTSYFFILFYLPVVSMFILPGLKRDNETAGLHITRVIANFMTVMFLSAIFYIGVSIAIAVVFALFPLDKGAWSNLYFYAWVGLAGIYAPLLFLALFPDYRAQNRDWEIPQAITFLIKYIETPLMLGYVAILYLYFIVALAKGEMPRGVSSYLVLAFSMGVILVHITVRPFREHSRFYSFLFRYIYYLIFPMLIPLAIAIYMRIGEYGITEMRYLLAAGGLWIFAISLYMTLSKRKSIQYIFISSAAVLLLSGFGPYHMFSAAYQSQSKRLKAELQKNGQYDQSGNLNVKRSKGVDFSEVSGIIEFLEQRDSDAYLDRFVAGDTKITYEDFVKQLKLKKIHLSGPKYFHLSASPRRLYSIQGYSHVFPVDLNLYGDSPDETLTDKHSLFGVRVENSRYITIMNENQILHKIDLFHEIEEAAWLPKRRGAPDLTLSISSAGYRFQLIVYEAGGDEKQGKIVKLNYLRGLLFIGKIE